MSKINVKDRLPSVAGLVYKTNIGNILFKGDGNWYGYDNVKVRPEWWEESISAQVYSVEKIIYEGMLGN